MPYHPLFSLQLCCRIDNEARNLGNGGGSEGEGGLGGLRTLFGPGISAPDRPGLGRDPGSGQPNVGFGKIPENLGI